MLKIVEFDWILSIELKPTEFGAELRRMFNIDGKTKSTKLTLLFTSSNDNMRQSTKLTKTTMIVLV